MRALGVALWVASGCAGGGGPPGWVQGEAPAEHPEVAYLSAVGAGESLDAARAAAKAELSRIFSAELDSVVRLVDEERTRSGVAVAESVLRVDTTIRSGLELQGAEVPLHWRDPGTGEVWAVAVLDRRRECARLREAGDDLATRLDRWVEEASREAHPLAAVRASLRAVALGLELDALRARSRVLGRACLAPRSHATGALLADLGARMEALRFVVDARDVDPSSGASWTRGTSTPRPERRLRCPSCASGSPAI